MLSTSVLESKPSNLIIDMTAPLEHPTKFVIWDEDATIFRGCDQKTICIRKESFMRSPTMDYINIRASVPFISSSGQWSHILFRKQNIHASPHDNDTLYSPTLPYSKKMSHVKVLPDLECVSCVYSFSEEYISSALTILVFLHGPNHYLCIVLNFFFPRT